MNNEVARSLQQIKISKTMKFYFNGPSTSHNPCLICKGIENLTMEKDKTPEQHHKFPTNLTQ